MLSFLLLSVPAFAADHLLIDFLDVGQGDGVLIQAPDGTTVLIDGGKPSAHVETQLSDLGVSQIDLLIATHADYDHSGGHEALLGSIPVDRYVTNGLAHTSKSYARIMALADTLVAAGEMTHDEASSFVAGEDLGVGDLHVYVLPPPSSITGTDQNTHSIGVVVEYLGFKTLISGDSEAAETAAWLTDASVYDLIDEVDVYKAIHHGSKDGDAGNTDWLDVVLPENVVVQVGPNSYGHPTAEALATYDGYAAQLWRNDEDGRVRVEVWESGGYTIETEVSGGVDYVSSHPVAPDTTNACPVTHPIKGNISTENIYHWPGGVYYDRTNPEECFGTSADALAAGYRASTR
jgi:competence protein ComEC